MKSLLITAVTILAVGCGEKNEPVAVTKPVEEKQQEIKEEVKPEEAVVETKPVEELPLNPNLKYEIKDGTVTITDCDEGASGKLVIPSTIEGKTVTSIGEGTFWFCTSLTSITIADSVTSVGGGAFMNCTNLKTITIPDSVTSIEKMAFYECKSLTSITIGNSVTSIGDMAFNGCTNLTAVTFLGDAPNNMRSFILQAPLTVYRKPEAKGWGDEWSRRPVKLISQKPVADVKLEEPVAETKPKTEGVNQDELEPREGIMYLKGSDTPYTGKVYGSDENGQKQVEANFKDGKEEGLAVVWHKNGQKESELNYKDGKMDGLWTQWHENGQKQREVNFKDGKEDGLAVMWHKNGQKGAECNWKDGKSIKGSVKFWNSKGQSVASEEEALEE